MDLTIRPARSHDSDRIIDFTRETWSDRDRGDYLPDVIADWITNSDDRQQTFVAVSEGDPVGVIDAVLLSADEAWLQGLRVAPDYRGNAIGRRLCRTGFDWAADRTADVARSMVFSWNSAGLGVSRAAGFDAVSEFRWAHPEPATGPPSGPDRSRDPEIAWQFWQNSPAYQTLHGLGLDEEEAWALSRVTRAQLVTAAENDELIVTASSGETGGLAVHTRTYDQDGERGPTERWVEYGVAAWHDLQGAKTLLEAISHDAGSRGADRIRVLLPESPSLIADVVAAGVDISEYPDFVMKANLPRDTR